MSIKTPPVVTTFEIAPSNGALIFHATGVLTSCTAGRPGRDPPTTARRPRRPFTRMTMAIAAIITSSALEAGTPIDSRPQIPLETMTYRDAELAGAVGTGCTWLGGPGRTSRMLMADDRAAVKRRGVIVSLKPAPNAKEVFPFTYHRWTGGGLDIAIRDTGKVLGRGREFVVTAAWLDLTSERWRRSWLGRLNCGS